MRRTAVARACAMVCTPLVAALVVAACASAPPASVSTHAAGPSFEQKLSWILRLEDERSLRDPAPAAVPPPPVVRGQTPIVVDAPPPPPDLVRLLADTDPRIRRRAALAVGRVGLRDATGPLAALLSDSDPEVRQMAAFALGLLGDVSARDALITALADPSPLVKTSATEALGLLGDASAAAPIARAAAQIVASGAFATPPGDDEDMRRDTPVSVFRVSVFALARLKAYEPLASAVLDEAGQPRVTWWPVAYALGRIEDPRASAALLALAKAPALYTRTFAVKGLGAVKERAAVPLILPLVTAPERTLAVEAIRALGKIGDPAAGPRLLALVRDPKTDPTLRVEALSAIGGVGGDGVLDTLLDLAGDKNPLVRAAVITSLPAVAKDDFVTVLSGLEADSDWRVRVELATVLGTLPPEAGLARLRAMLGDDDQRVVPAVLESLARLHPPDAGDVMIEALRRDDPAVRAAAAEGLAMLKPQAGVAALAAAYAFGQRDLEGPARTAALEGLAAYATGAGTPPAATIAETLTAALADKDWAVRRRAAALLMAIDSSSDAAHRIRPAATGHAAEFYQAEHLIKPPVSTAVYLDTDRGTIQIELAVVDAPLAVEAFIGLAQKNFYDGVSFHRVVPDFVIQAGDPRGDGEGGAGFSLRDELSEQPFVRGTVGLAIDGPDTGSSQFFIMHAPAPHLDAKYTVIGHVVAGMDVVDQIQRGDVIRKVRVWNGG